MNILDANVVIRVLLNEESKDGQKAREIISNIEKNQIETRILTDVIAQVIYVMTSKQLYWYSRELVITGLLLFFKLPNISIENENTIMKTFTYFREDPKLEFVDCLLLATQKHLWWSIHTLDRYLKKRSQE